MEVMDMGTMLTLSTVSTTPFPPGFFDLFFSPLLFLINVFENHMTHIAELKNLSFFVFYTLCFLIFSFNYYYFYIRGI